MSPKRDKETRDASKLNNKELHDLHLSPEIIKISRPQRKKQAGLGGACDCCREEKNAFRFLVGTPKGKRLLGRPRYRWEDQNALASFICFNKGTSGELLQTR